MTQVVNNIETHHMVDNETSVCEAALIKFRQLFSGTRVNVWDPNLGMSYHIRHRRYADAFKKEADKIIAEYNLPLVARIIKGHIDSTLIIESTQHEII